MKSNPTRISCQCGTVQGQVENITPSSSNHLTCHCKYCSGFAVHLGKAERLVDDSGASDLLQVAPWSLRFISGQDNIRALRFSEKGPLRWYASCCDTPLGITLARRFPPFCALVVQNLGFQNGGPPPVIFNAFCEHVAEKARCSRGGRLPALRIAARLAKQAVKGGISLKWRDNPFLDLRGGQAMAEVKILSPEERENAFAPLLS